MSSAFFQGGDFVELLSAQGKSPAAAWKLQGKISKTFEKGIKGNTFQLEGNSETKMQLPKTASSSLGLAQRFVVLQLLVPFIRSFSVEICFSDFQKVRRRFVVASAFRETARTALHVQLPLSTAGVPRDQWINLVFDLLSLSEVHFPGTGYRSMESICVGGSCRLKRIFTMKDAPAPSRGSQVVQHADIRDIPRQFVFSATQRGVSGALPLPTLYFTMQKASGAHEVPIVTSTIKGETLKSSRRSQTAPVKAQTKVAKGTRTGRPASEMHQRKMTHPESASHTAASSTKTVGREPQRLRTPVRVSTTGSKLRQPQSRLCKVVVSKQPSVLQQTELTGIAVGVSSPSRALDEENIPEVQENDLRISLSPVRASRSGLAKQQEETRSADTPSQTECKSPSWAQNQGSVLSNLLSSSTDGVQQQRMQSQSLRQSILGEIQQKLASLEDEDEREDQRNRELFLRHTSLHSGEWHLQQLRDEDLHSDDGALVSDDESEHVQLSSSWRREMNDSNTNVMVSSTEMKQRRNQEVIPPRISRSTTDKATIFSFSSSVEQKTQSTLKSTARLFDFDSLLQDEKSSTPLLDKEQARSSIRSELHGHPCADVQNESTVMDTEYDADDLELDKLLAAKRSARQLTPQSQVTCLTGNDVLPKEKESISAISNDDNDLRDEEQLSGDRVEDERGDWVVVENNIEGNGHEEASNYNCTDQEKEWHLRPSGILEEESGLGSGNEDDALSIDLTSELSASGRNFHDLEDEGDLESSVSPTTPEITDKHKPESDRESSDADDDSSFDFEDLVEDAESSDERTEEGENRADYGDTLKKPISAMAGQPKELTLKPSSSPPRNQTTHEHRELPTELGSLKSPLVDYPSPTGARSKLLHKSSSERPCEPSHPVELSSSFSSRRLQTLLESTDWTAELNAQANPSHVSGNPTPPFARSSDRRLKNAGSSDPKTPVSKARPLSRSQTASTSSIELVYDPLLRCYYDPIANKYYALAE